MSSPKTALVTGAAARIGACTAARGRSRNRLHHRRSVLTEMPVSAQNASRVWPLASKRLTSARHSSRLRNVSASSVVPTSTIRNRMRSGVMRTMLISRADSVTGVMSPNRASGGSWPPAWKGTAIPFSTM